MPTAPTTNASTTAFADCKSTLHRGRAAPTLHPSSAATRVEPYACFLAIWFEGVRIACERRHSTRYVARGGKPNAVTRALASGVPVIASDIPRQAELVEDDETGLVVPPGDLPAWREALQAAASAPVRRDRWAVRARQVAEERHDWGVVAGRVEELLFAACERHAPQLSEPESSDAATAESE